ncbi:hypothetical protein FSBG_00108 [Fusobacterium gonidiaformans 3-1-5R]|uniref:DUF4376 domain-containing protein n=1 Tax=Fusobacterium gonidiaformans 3-1-5R TaxID=469605 RepID=E5BET0_9FUSO|nr:hypothetical protein [Fusobacterium gonidiaformans]EFS20611.1 hypothetical protein FSBG_00108 [Fusobacterium gonidiaformans 3-1-5R]
MKYFYVSRNALVRDNAVVVYGEYTIQIPLEAYRSNPNTQDAIEYISEDNNFPNDWAYDSENDVIFSQKDRPSPYHVFVKGVWIVKDKEGLKKYCEENIDKIKKEVLEYGFDYQGHRQRCRDKDVAYMVANIVALQTAQTLGKEKKVTWYFEDNHGMTAGVQELGVLMLYGTTFVQSVYDTENYFKTLEEPKIITKEEFEQKRKTIHQALAGGEL